MTFVCKQCGVEFEGKPDEKSRVFCSKACFDKFKAQSRYFICPHNDAVDCEQSKKKCHKCGWNPSVAKHRMDKLMYQEELDALIHRDCDEFYPFYERYPQLKQFKYDKARKGWK